MIKSRMSWLLSGTSLMVLMLYILSGLGINKVVNSVSGNVLNNKRKTVIIDAGHGGEDGGSTSCTGVLESEINLQIALKLNELMHLLGVRTVMIRTEDKSIYTQGNTIAEKKVSDLKERVRIVNNTDQGVLISIHQNYFPDNRYKGAQVFYAESYGSADLAQSMQEALLASINKGSNRKIKKADNIYLMEHITRTGILVECGFLSNPEEEAFLRDDVYQKKLCCVIACVMSSYLNSLNTLS